jgi:DNA gyrase subunit A
MAAGKDEEAKEKAKKTDEPITAKKPENVRPRIIEEEMKESYLDYSMSVIVGRALPDVRDGLKPVHRRIIYAMHDMGMLHSRPYKKSARIVGEVLGKYHPHGDQAVYDALVRMVQTFSLRYPLIDGQGNFGSVDGDGAAAMRYTECRMSKTAQEMIADIEKETVKFVQNFDGSLKEPSLLPGKMPNLLVNGSSGIAVGMATNIPPHNMNEVADGIIATIDNPLISLPELMAIINGPDFPTGGMIMGTAGLIQAYTTGKGGITVRGKADIEKRGGDKERITITEIPYQVNKSKLIEDMARLARDKIIKGVTNIRDESDKEGMRIIIDVSQNEQADVILNQIYKHTQLQTTFGIIMLSLVGNQPRVLSLKQMVEEFIRHRKLVVTKRTEFDLREASEKAHVLEGILVALNDIDDVIKKIKSSQTVDEAKKRLEADFKLSAKQAQAILEMRLQRLASLERQKVKDEHEALIKLMAELRDILADEGKVYGIIKSEMHEMKKKYGDERRTEIVGTGEGVEDLEDDRLIKKEDVVVTISNDDYVKRMPLDEYRQQKRGGKGVIGTKTKEGDIVKEIYVMNTHDYLLCFSSKGRVHWMKAYRIPEAGKYARGKPVVNLLKLGDGERLKDIIPVEKFDEGKFIFFVTKKGLVKKTDLPEYGNPRSSGIIALKLNDGDDLIQARLTDGKEDVIIATRHGYAIRFSEKDVRPTGRTAHGVRGIRIRGKDEVIGVSKVERGSLFTVTEKGYGKRTKFEFYRQQRRGGKGVKNLKVTGKNGDVIGIVPLHDNDEIMFVSREGQIIRTFAKDIHEIGRATQGVRVMRLNEGDKLVSYAKICESDTKGL